MTARVAPLLLIALAGCHRSQPEPPKVRTFKLVGQVKAVDRPGGWVTIRHEAIPGYMPKMTMPFRVAKKEDLEDVEVGDEVEGTFRVEAERSELSDLVVTRPAPPPERVLDTSGGSPQLKPKPPPLEVGRPVPDFAMTTQEGRPLRLSDLRGKVVVLTFVYTRCPVPEFCPAMDRRFAQLARQLAGSPRRSGRVRLLSVSFDPEHDTPEALAKHAKLQGARPPLWTYAVASHAELQKVAGPLGLTYGPTGEGIVHNLETALIAPDGTLAHRESGNGWTADAMGRRIDALLRATADPGR